MITGRADQPRRGARARHPQPPVPGGRDGREDARVRRDARRRRDRRDRRDQAHHLRGQSSCRLADALARERAGIARLFETAGRAGGSRRVRREAQGGVQRCLSATSTSCSSAVESRTRHRGRDPPRGGLRGLRAARGPRARRCPTTARPRRRSTCSGWTLAPRRGRSSIPADWFSRAQHRAARTRASVLGLDPAERLAGRSRRRRPSRYDRGALIATGANVRRLQVDGAQLEGIHYLRALANADAIRADAERAGHVVCVGGSYIASEVAASLTAAGAQGGPWSCSRTTTRSRAASAPPRGGTSGGVLEGPRRRGPGRGGARRGSRAPSASSAWRLSGRGGGRTINTQAAVVGVEHAARRDARAQGRPHHRRARWGASPTRACATSAPGRLRRGRHRRVRERRPRRQPRCGSSTGTSPTTRARTAARCACSARDDAARRRPVLLLRPRRLGVDGVRRPGLRAGTEEIVRGSIDDGEFTVFYLDGDRARRRADGRPLRRPRAVARELITSGEPVDREALKAT